MRKRSLILVEWDDIAADNTWWREDEVEAHSPIKTYTVGWKMKSDSKNLRMASTRCENGKCADVIAIPRGCVRNIERLK